MEGITGPLHGGFEDFTIDVSLSKNADDLCRVIPLEVGCDMDEALMRMKSSDDILDECLTQYGMTQNRDKQVACFTIQGTGSQQCK
eukprot:5476047-Pyramimonas_sp.AAC.1